MFIESGSPVAIAAKWALAASALLFVLKAAGAPGPLSTWPWVACLLPFAAAVVILFVVGLVRTSRVRIR